MITTHGIFVNDGLQKLKNSGLIKKLICTDSHANCSKLINDDFVEIRTIAGLISGLF